MRLDPKPGRAYGGAEARSVVPEVTIEKIKGEYVVILNDQGLPALRVARVYRLQAQLSPEERRFVAERRKLDLRIGHRGFGDAPEQVADQRQAAAALVVEIDQCPGR